MFQHSIVIDTFILLTMLSGTRAEGGLPPCTNIDCVQPYVAYDTQNRCVEETRPPQEDCRWFAGMDRRADEIIYSGSIAAYKIQWFNGNWSGWFVPGFNDFDHKFNPAAKACPDLPVPANGLRRVWGLFNDHNHTVVICYSPVNCTTGSEKNTTTTTRVDPTTTTTTTTPKSSEATTTTTGPTKPDLRTSTTTPVNQKTTTTRKPTIDADN